MELVHMKLPRPLPHFAPLNVTNDYVVHTNIFLSLVAVRCRKNGCRLYLFALNPEGEPAEKRSPICLLSC